MKFERAIKPDDWPANGREYRLDIIWEKMDDFENKPSYKTREALLAFVNDNDLNQVLSFGLMRFTAYAEAHGKKVNYLEPANK